MQFKQFYTLGLLITIISQILGIEAFADVEEDVTVHSSVPYYTIIEKSNSSVNSGSVTPASGVHSGLSTVFLLQTNGTDDNFDFIITSKIDTQTDPVSAYGNDGRILFSNSRQLPTIQAVDNAKAGSGVNQNVIAYQTSISATNGLSAAFETNYENYGNCYVIKVNNAESGVVTHNVLGTPVLNTYSVSQDEEGEYKATLSFTSIAK